MSDFDPDKPEQYEPNAVQREFIRLAAEKYYWLVLGDTGHDRARIQAFMMNKTMANTLARGGKRNFFFEEPECQQEYFDWLMAIDNRHADCTVHYLSLLMWRFSSAHLNSLEGCHVRQVFEKAAKGNKDIDFVAADRRGIRMGSLGFATRILLFKAVGMFMKHDAEKRLKTLLQILAKDEKTAAYMKSKSAPSAIKFGAAHFETKLDNAQRPHLLGSLLPEKDKPLCVLNVYGDQTQRTAKEQFNVSGFYGDAELYVDPFADCPDGIKINNPVLQPLYDEARRIVAGAGFRPAPV